MDEKRAIELLGIMKKILDKHNITFWINAGTMLGAIRSGKFISFDHDIDLGIWVEDREKLKEAIKETEFSAYFDDYFSYNGIKITTGNMTVGIRMYDKDKEISKFRYMNAESKKGEFIDYMLWCLKLRHAESKEDSIPLYITKFLVGFCKIIPAFIRRQIIRFLHYVYIKVDSDCKVLVLPNHYYRDLKEIDFYGLKVKIPVKAEELLEYRFGEDWRTPRTDYVYWKDCKALEK